MNQCKINLLQLDAVNHDQLTQEHPKKFFFPKTIAILVSLLFIGLGASSVFSYQQSQNESSGISRAFHMVFSSGPLRSLSPGGAKQLIGESEDRINVLLLGIGGKNHDGPYLSDTIVIVSVKPSTKQVAFISVPRDLQVYMDGYGWRKINDANALGESVNPGYGPEFARQVISKTFDIPLHYYVRVDFNGFAKIIDILDGITLTVDNTFTDYTYPAANYKYQTISFRAGENTMNGETALKFVRSRHSIMNNEGSDFARSKRQQKVLLAVKEKILNKSFFLNPQKISEVLATLQEHMATDMRAWEIATFAMLAPRVDQHTMIHFVFDNSPENFLIDSTSNGAYILQPKSGTFLNMQEKVKTIFETPIETSAESSSVAQEKPTVRVQNGTHIEGLAGKTARKLTNAGFTVLSLSNAEERDAQHTRIYNSSDELKKESRIYLESLFDISAQTKKPSNIHTDSDFLIILGNDAAQNVSQ
jgi:LCP family protein required for cell wall assembly